MCHILPSVVLWDLRPVFNQESEGWSFGFEDREEEKEERKERRERGR